tara:strand:+ start:200 stop:460 length:261 start_codon:yes stop_codon:yes gene_type:complete
MNKNNLTYAIINIDDLLKIDFSQVGETSSDTIRKSLDLTQFVIKWEAEPTFIKDGNVVPVECLDHDNVLILMRSEKWSEPDQFVID